MQLIILGMHRGGTSVVARLLNMMGAYFAPEGIEMPPTDDNPKGYWERTDIWKINERVLRSVDATWHLIDDWDIKKISEETQAQFFQEAEPIVRGLDAHRPWMLKDPRLNLLLPLWLELLEVPVCIHVYRDPIQIAQSLYKRNDYPLNFGLALWEQYTLQSLQHSRNLPSILISYHDLMANPVGTVKQFYDDLQAIEVRGLYLPSSREIEAFIDKKLHRQQGNNALQNNYINFQQQQLAQNYANGEVLNKAIPELSGGAIDALRQHRQEIDQQKKLDDAYDKFNNLQEKFFEAQQSWEETLKEKEHDLAVQKDQLQTKEEQLQVKDKQVQTQQDQLQTKDKQLQTQEKTLTQQTQQLQNQQRELSQQAQRLQAQQNQLGSVQAQLKNKEQALSQQKQRLETQLKTQLETQKNTLQNKQTELQKQQQVITELQASNKEKNRYLFQLEQFNDKYEHDLDAVFASITWRSGETFANIARRLTFKGKEETVKEHFFDLKKMVHKARRESNNIPVQVGHYSAPTTNTTTQIAKKTEPSKPTVLPQSNSAVMNIPQENNVSKKIDLGETWDTNKPLIDIIICVYNALEDVKLCIESVRKNTVLPYKLIIVNDKSDEATTTYLRSLEQITLLENEENQGYTRAANRGFQASQAPYKIILNSDTQVTLGWVNHLLQCLLSHPQAGIVSPLSNAASYQSVPQVFQNGTKEWYMETPPFDIERWSELVAETRINDNKAWLPNLNGFCLLIKQAVFDKIGYFDEENYPHGYGEENDLCLRAQDAGFSTLVTNDAYVFHAKSKSFTHERRKKLATASHKNYARKFGDDRLKWNTYFLQQLNPLEAQRRRLRQATAPSHLRLVYILPVTAISGGVISVMQVVVHLNLIGVQTSVIIPSALRDEALDIFNIDAAHVIGFDRVANIPALAQDFDIVIATHNSSVAYVNDTLQATDKAILPAYFVQDYEPWFYGKGSDRYHQAEQSYTLIPNQVCFAKTQYLVDTVRQYHKTVNIHKIRPGFDINIYSPDATKLPDHTPLRICAMIRPVSPRRAPQKTLDVLETLLQRFPNEVEIHIFGAKAEELTKLKINPAFKQHGVLDQDQLFKLLQDNDIFLDMSPYQAFGRTGLEAMAAGCLAILPDKCGTAEYAHKDNAILLDMRNTNQVIKALTDIINEPQRRMQLKRCALDTALSYNCMGDALTQWELLKGEYRLRFDPPKVSLIMLVHNQREMTQTCLNSLKNTHYPNYELIIIDNASDDETKTMLKQHAADKNHVHIIHNAKNESFSHGNNQGAEKASGELLLLINNDLEFSEPDWLTKLVHSMLIQPTVAAVGPRLLFDDGKVQSAGVRIQVDKQSYDFTGAEEIRRPMPSRKVDAVTGACMLIWKDIYQSLEGLDNRYWYGQEDVDLCLQLRVQGYHIYHCAEVSVIHHESKTRSFNETTLKNRAAIREKWAGRLLNWSTMDK